MAVLATKLKSTSQILHAPALHLKAKGCLKTIGQRQLTKYFPVTH
jgi:hypothetical protein